MNKLKFSRGQVFTIIIIILLIVAYFVVIGPSTQSAPPSRRWQRAAYQGASLYYLNSGVSNFSYSDLRDEGYVIYADRFGNLPSWRFEIIGNSGVFIFNQLNDNLVSYGSLDKSPTIEDAFRYGLDVATYYDSFLCHDGLLTQHGVPVFFDNTIYSGSRTQQAYLSHILPTTVKMKNGSEVQVIMSSNTESVSDEYTRLQEGRDSYLEFAYTSFGVEK